MSASPETLHLLAHQAQLRARTDPDWWENPLDTALAAISAARHPPAFRKDGETAVERLDRWRHEGHARRLSADVAALALAARAAGDLGLPDRGLKRAAVEAATDLAGRSRSSAPLLHVALVAWALDLLVPDRDSDPWAAFRRHLSTTSARGVEAPIWTLARAVCASRFDADGLVRALLVEVPPSPGLEDGVVLLWVLTAAVERCAGELAAGDTGLRALADRRAELAVRLAQELDADAFKPPELADFDPDAELEVRAPVFVSPMEALLLDISLASREREKPWLRFEEAAVLFGQRERDARRGLALRTSILGAAAGLMAGAMLGIVLDDAGTRRLTAVLAGLTLASMTAFLAAVVWHRESRSPAARAVVACFLTLAISAALDLLNSSLEHPLLSDAAGVIIGLLGTSVITLAVAATSGKPPPNQ